MIALAGELAVSAGEVLGRGSLNFVLLKLGKSDTVVSCRFTHIWNILCAPLARCVSKLGKSDTHTPHEQSLTLSST